MGGAADYIRAFFPVFLLGAVFGKLTEAGGGAASIAGAIVRAARPATRDPGRRDRLRRAHLRRRLAIRRGVRGLPVRGVLVPEGGDPEAAPPRRDRARGIHADDGRPPGIAADPEPDPDPHLRHGLLCSPGAGLPGRDRDPDRGPAWLDVRRARAAAAGEGYGAGHAHEPEARPLVDLPSASSALLPLILVLATNFVASRSRWSISAWYSDALTRGHFPRSTPGPRRRPGP